jgi:hypothetical protein
MKRNLTLIIVVVAILVLSFASNSALACERAKCCEANCETEKTADGFRCTMRAEDDTEVAKLREMVKSCSAHSSMEGVDISIEEIEGGVVMTHSATDAVVIEALHAKADACASCKCGSCSHGDCKGDCGKDCGKKHDGCKCNKASESTCGHAAGTV